MTIQVIKARRFSRADGNYGLQVDTNWVGISGTAHIAGAWVKLNSTGTSAAGYIIAYLSGAPVYNQGPSLYYNGTYFQVIGNNPGFTLSSVTVPKPGIWYHVGFYYEGQYSTDICHIVVNGVLEASATWIDPTLSYYFNYPLTIGGGSEFVGNPTNNPEADIADPFFGNEAVVTVLPLGVFRRFYEGARPWQVFRTKQLRIALEFGNPNNPVADRSGNGRTFSVTGGSIVTVDGPVFCPKRIYYLDGALPVSPPPPSALSRRRVSHVSRVGTRQKVLTS